MKQYFILIIFLLLTLLSSCSYQPEPIEYGKDVCSHCSMAIVEKPFGSELITKQGKIEKFDSIECLAAFILKGIIQSDKIHSMWVTDFFKNNEFIQAENAYYLYSKSIRSPMGMFLSAYRDKEKAGHMVNEHDGEILDWKQVKDLVYKEWISL